MNQNSKRYFRISAVTFGVCFILFGLAYIICLFPVWSSDEGMGEVDNGYEIVFRTVTLPGYILNPLLDSFVPGLLIHLIDIVIMSLLSAWLFNFAKILLSKQNPK